MPKVQNIFTEINPDIFYVGAPHPADPYCAQPISLHIWGGKYRWANNPLIVEGQPSTSIARVCEGIYRNDTQGAIFPAEAAMKSGIWLPAGRIQAGAGTSKVVTLMNCYVDRDIEDSMSGIADALKDAMLTMQQGGGIGMNFSTLRPSGAWLQRTGAVASGPLPFMDMWDSMCATIMSAGDRRGAMMGVMAIDHPDIIDFIHAKQKPGRLTNFNVSVLVSDAFMQAVSEDEEWSLGFGVPRHDGNHIGTTTLRNGKTWYIYKVIKARELWNLIIRNTYEYSEPGVIFIDRVNDWNNLKYVEVISCTNPCGEQPLPPNGACNLGAVNLARMVGRPYSKDCMFNWEQLKAAVCVGVRFLDNVIDVTHYPLQAQEIVEKGNRRIGLGITGLANAMMMMGIRYGSEESLSFTNKIMDRLKNWAYEASAHLAAERGSFPLYDERRWGQTPVVESLDDEVKELISRNGIRNGVLLTIAPTGTTSLYCGNISSGLEPVFAHKMERKIRRPDGEFDTHVIKDYGLYVWEKYLEQMQKDFGKDRYPDRMPEHFVSTADLEVRDHIRMQSTCQRHVDASISKTINCPEDMSFEDFKLVYWDAYEMLCKGCTTYRPSDVRGSILTAVTDGVPGGADASDSKVSAEALAGKPERSLVPRPKVLSGKTYKIKWPNVQSAHYVTINNDDDGHPFEMFIGCTNATHQDWATALSLMISAIFRKGGNIDFVGEELQKIISATDSAWVDGKYWGSLVALIGHTIQLHCTPEIDEPQPMEFLASKSMYVAGEGTVQIQEVKQPPKGRICPKCGAPTLYMHEGCKQCTNCGYSTCG